MTKYKRSRIFFDVITLITVLSIVACKKEEPDSSYIKCYIQNDQPGLNAFPLPGPTGYDFVYDSSFIRSISFNPKNPDEFIFNTFSNTIYRYSRSTGVKQSIFSDYQLSPPKWGKNGWILINKGLVWKLKPDGDSLTQLTFTGNYYDPVWSYDGSKFLAETVPGSGVQAVTVLVDFNTLKSDTIRFARSSGGDWQNANDLFVEFSVNQIVGRGFIVLDTKNGNPTPIKVSQPHDQASSPVWLNENVFAFVSNRKFYSYNMSTLKYHEFGELPEHHVAGNLNFLKSTNELAAKIDIWTYKGNNEVEISSKIAIYDLNNCTVSYIKP